MDLSYQRRLAAEVLKAGKDRIWFDESHLKEIKEAVTREAIKELIDKGYIKKNQKKGVSRVRANYIMNQKKKGLRKGQGTRKGKKGARTYKKGLWMKQIRAVRRMLRELKANKTINVSQYRLLYRQVSAGRIRTKSYLKMYVEKMLRREKSKE